MKTIKINQLIMRLLFVIPLMISLNVYSQHNIKKHFRVIKDTMSYDSLIQVFYPSGKLFYQVPYKEGKMNGWYEQYHENGTVCGKDLRIDGNVVDGFNVSFWDNGTIYQKGYYKNGHQVGKWYVYSDDGRPLMIYCYNKTGYLNKTKYWMPKTKKWKHFGKKGYHE